MFDTFRAVAAHRGFSSFCEEGAGWQGSAMPPCGDCWDCCFFLEPLTIALFPAFVKFQTEQPEPRLAVPMWNTTSYRRAVPAASTISCTLMTNYRVSDLLFSILGRRHNSSGLPSISATTRYHLHGPGNTSLLVPIHLVSLPILQQLMAVSSKTGLGGEANPA